MISGPVAIFTKIVIKAVIAVERLYTLVKRGVEKDPTALISELYPVIESLASTDHVNGKNIKIGVIVPFRDRWDMTLSCLRSLERQKIDPGVTLALYLVNNGSVAKETLDGIKSFQNQNLETSLIAVKVLDIDIPFNFSILCNRAAKLAEQDGCSHILLLNNDIDLDDASTIEQMLKIMMSATKMGRKVGAIGCTLLYPNRVVQHLYVAPGVKIIAAHPGKGIKFDHNHIWHDGPRYVPAVTGALMLTSVEAWRVVGGLDENLPSSGQDVDYCLKLTKRDFEIFVPGKVYAIHKEGVSRGKDISRRDVQYMYDRWPELWLGSHPRLSFWSEKPLLKLMMNRFPWRLLVRN